MNEPKPSGPSGQCCAKCLYAYKTRDGGLICRRWPVENHERVTIKAPSVAVLEKQPQPEVQSTIDITHPWTIAEEWCGEYKRNVEAMN